MEVHNHPHVEKKNLKEYVLEFLMIFLAVTLGFFAENIREFISERGKENIDIQSISRNLLKDSATILYQIQNNKSEINAIDSLMDLIKSARYKSEPEMLYRFAYSTRGFQAFDYSNVTYEEMKNSASFNLIRNYDVRSDLMNYNNFIVNSIGNLESRMFQTEANQANLQSEILDDSFYPPVNSIINQHALRSHFYKKENSSISFSPEKVGQFSKLYNLLFERDVIANYYQLNLQKLKNLNGHLLTEINKEYQPEK